MTEEEYARRVQELLDQEQKKPERWHLLSFAMPGKFLGVTIVRARGMISATRRAHALGINPGGSVRSYEFDKISKPPFELFEKLVTDKAMVQKILDTWGD
jgi:hypothetical protein